MVGCLDALNVYHSYFYCKVLADVSSMLTTVTILGGDFNCVLDPEADHNPPSNASPSKNSFTNIELYTDLNLFDA